MTQDAASGLLPAASASRPRNIAVLLLAVVLAAALLAWSLRGTDWQRIRELFLAADLRLVASVLALATMSLACRAFRWRILLTAEAFVPFPAAFWATAAGYFGNNFLPARGGEVVRTLIISRRTGLSSAYVLTTALAERAVDAIALVVISAAVLLAIPSPPGWLAAAVKPFAILAFVAVLAIILLPSCESFGGQVISRMPGPPKLRSLLAHILERSLRALRAFHDPARLIGFLLLTALIWTLDAICTVIGAHALGLAMPLSVAFLLIAGLGLGSAVPSVPGYVGIYQFVAVSVLQPFGFTRTDAIGYILFAQALSYLLIGVWGSIGFVRSRKLTSPSQP